MVEASKIAGSVSLALSVLACMALVYSDWTSSVQSNEMADYSANADSGTAYIFVNTPLPYSEARDKCEALGLTLATLDTQSKWSSVREETENRRVWIGYTVEPGRENDKNAWKWESGAPVGLDKWLSGKPRRDTNWPEEYCGLLSENGEFINTQCNTRLPFVCDNHPSVAEGEANRYIMVHGVYNWDQANDECRKRYGTTLASVQGRDEQMRLRNNQWVWLGLRKIPGQALKSKSDFKYTSAVQSTVEPAWYGSEPSLTNQEYCVVMRPDGYLENRRCTDRFHYFACDSKLLNGRIQSSRFEWHTDWTVRRNYALPSKQIVFGDSYRGYRLTLSLMLRSLRPTVSNILRVGSSQEISLPSLNQRANQYAVEIVESYPQGTSKSGERILIQNQWRRFDIEASFGGLKLTIDETIVYYDSPNALSLDSNEQSVYLSDPFFETSSAIVKDVYFSLF